MRRNAGPLNGHQCSSTYIVVKTRLVDDKFSGRIHPVVVEVESAALIAGGGSPCADYQLIGDVAPDVEVGVKGRSHTPLGVAIL